MSKWYYALFATLIVIIGFTLRIVKIENRAPFDWDQNRDYQVVNQLASGKYTLIGPVAKGEGGFYLAPLYYYLTLPAFILFGKDPISLPLTSVIMDMISVILILVLIPRIWGRWHALGLALLWSISWFAIEMSRISWNVSLVQLWVVSLIYLLASMESKPRYLLLGLILGLSWHVHAVLIPLGLALTMVHFKLLALNPRKMFLLVSGYVLAIAPLILFDLRHSGLERHLILEFLRHGGTGSTTLGPILISALSRLGKNTYAIMTGTSSLSLFVGLVTVGLATVSTAKVHPKIIQLSGWIIILNFVLVVSLREIGFPEYYFSSCYLPVLVILLYLTSKVKHYLGMPISLVLIGIFAYFNLSAYTAQKTTFSLAQKQALVSAIAGLGHTIALHTDLPFGRDAGLPILLSRANISLKNDAPVQVLITESTAPSIFLDGELAKEIGWYGGFRLGYRVVQ